MKLAPSFHGGSALLRDLDFLSYCQWQIMFFQLPPCLPGQRVFLEAKLTFTYKRMSLSIDAIEALECLKSSVGAGTFTKNNLFNALDQVQEA